jgi:hypothetical protein
VSSEQASGVRWRVRPAGGLTLHYLDISYAAHDIEHLGERYAEAFTAVVSALDLDRVQLEPVNVYFLDQPRGDELPGLPGGSVQPDDQEPALWVIHSAEQPVMGPAALAAPPAGLTAIEAERRLTRFGPNEVETGQRFWALRPALEFTTNPLVLILLAASLVSGLLGEVLNATLIAAMVVLSVGLNYYQILNSEQAARKLRSMAAPTARVWRDGRLEERPVRDIVPGDLLEVRAGDLVGRQSGRDGPRRSRRLPGPTDIDP